MTRFNEQRGDQLGDHDDQLEWAEWAGYKEGVHRVLACIESINGYPKLLKELKWAIKEGII